MHFLKGAFYFFTVLMLVNCGALLSIYAAQGKEHAQNSLQLLTISNISQNPSKMWAAFAISLVTGLFGCFFLLRHRRRVNKVETICFHDAVLDDSDVARHTILISGIPPTLKPEAGDMMIFQYFRSLYRGQVLSAHIIPDMRELHRDLKLRFDYLRRLGFYVDENERKSKRAMIKIGSWLLWWRRREWTLQNITNVSFRC